MFAKSKMFMMAAAAGFSLSACGGLIDAVNDAAEQAARGLAADTFIASGLGPTMTQLFDATGEAIDAASEATPPAPAFGALQSVDGTVTVDETIDVETGGSITVKGTATTVSEVTNDVTTVTVTIDLTADWEELGAQAVTSSGSQTMKGSVMFSSDADVAQSGSIDIVGSITIDRFTFDYDLNVAVDGDSAHMTGTFDTKQVDIEIAFGGDEPMDGDGDGVDDADDNCPQVANEDQADADSNGVGDACDQPPATDFDQDGTNDDTDNCPMDANADQADGDSDGAGDVCDAFQADATEQMDTDSDGIGDNADTDDDGDTIEDAADNCPMVPNQDQLDANANNIGDACEAPPMP